MKAELLKKEIYNKIKKYDKIVLARHIGADPDALGSTMGLKELILNTFPKKKVSVVGVYSSKFKYMGKLDKLDEDEISESLLIVCDTPNLVRIDGIEDVNLFKDVIKIDHHPEIDKFGTTSWIDVNESSVCQMIIELAYSTRLKMNKEAAEKLFMGLISDTNRFLYDCTSANTLSLASKLIEDTKIDFVKLYTNLYSRPLSEVRFEGYLAENIKVTDNGLAYIKIDEKLLSKFGVDSASTGNIVGNFNNIDEILVWVFFTEDSKQEIIKVNARSRGPIVNKVLEKYNGGGHKFASGARLKTKKDIDNIIKDLDEVCKIYKKENKD